jgi:hypothetical protein
MALKVSAHVRRIEAVEKDLKALAETSASKDDISKVRAEVKKLYDGLHIGKSLASRSLCCHSSILSRILGFAVTCVGYP